jgi:hypothetical protein
MIVTQVPQIPVRSFQDCLKVQSDLNRLVDWCGANSFELDVGECKSIIFSRICYPVEFPYMLGGIILDRVDYITDLEVVMDSRMLFSRHIDVTVRKALPMLGFVKKFSGEFRDSYILRTLNLSHVCPKLEHASCVWWPFYDARINRIERVQRKFAGYALRGLGWTDTYDLPPYVDQFTLIRLETLTRRRSDAFVIFVFDVLYGSVCAPNLLSLLPHSG